MGSPATAITCQTEKTELQKAEDYLHGHQLDEAAICLRKAAEDMAKRYREWATKTKLPPGEFFTLTENLRAAKNKLLEKIPTQLYDRVLKGTPASHRDHLIPASDDDVDALPGLDPADRGKLKCARKHLRSLLKDVNWKAMENIKRIDELLEITERVLNPGAHGGDAPFHEQEVDKALDVVRKFESISPSLMQTASSKIHRFVVIIGNPPLKNALALTQPGFLKSASLNLLISDFCLPSARLLLREGSWRHVHYLA